LLGRWSTRDSLPVPIVDIAGCQAKGKNLATVVDDQMQLETVEPTGGALPARRDVFEHFVRMYPFVMANVERCGIYKADPRTLANPELHEVYC